MIVYLVVVSLANLGLGYGLAVYMSRARANAAVIETAPPTTAQSSETPCAVDEGERRQENRTEPWAVAESHLPAAPEEAAGVETELLAGLQEFRNQLSQLKGESGLPASALPAQSPAAGS